MKRSVLCRLEVLEAKRGHGRGIGPLVLMTLAAALSRDVSEIAGIELQDGTTVRRLPGEGLDQLEARFNPAGQWPPVAGLLFAGGAA